MKDSTDAGKGDDGGILGGDVGREVGRADGVGVGSGFRMRLSASAVPREAPTIPKMMRKTSNQI